MASASSPAASAHPLPPKFLSHPAVIMRTMTMQLVLIDDSKADWRLDEKTKEAGQKMKDAAD